MENLKNNFENSDPWRKAILSERERKGYEPMLEKALGEYAGERENALILGDASLVQADFLLEQHNFAHVVDVDSSPTLLDDVIVKRDDTRLERVVSTFDEYDFSEKEFDLVYGKSIAFNPKETVEALLKNITSTLTEKGIFYAVWAGEKDSYRHGIFYTLDEIQDLYSEVGLEIMEMNESSNPVPGLLGRAGTKHEFKTLAKKK